MMKATTKSRTIGPTKIPRDTLIVMSRTFMNSPEGQAFCMIWAEQREALIRNAFRTKKGEDIAVVEGFDAAAKLIPMWSAKPLKSEMETPGEEE